MHTLHLDLGSRSYPIYIDAGLFEDESLFTAHIRAKRVCIVTNDIVAPLYLEQLKEKLTDLNQHLLSRFRQNLT